MPVTKSAQKALKKEARNRKSNLSYIKKIKNLKKQILSKKGEGQGKEAQKMLSKYYKTVDKAAKVGVIKKNTANRKKAGMARIISKS